MKRLIEGVIDFERVMEAIDGDEQILIEFA